jgi:hypothetical protein
MNKGVALKGKCDIVKLYNQNTIPVSTFILITGAFGGPQEVYCWGGRARLSCGNLSDVEKRRRENGSWRCVQWKGEGRL